MCDLHFLTLAVLVVFTSSRGGYAQVAMYDVRVDNLLKMQQGVGWPTEINVVKGHEALMRLTTTLANTRDCKVFTPAGLEFDARNPPSARYEFWSNGCGIRIKNVGASDHGRWRLVVTRGAESITGWSELILAEDPPSQTPTDRIALQDGKEHAAVNLTTLANSYCLVTQPFSESSLVSGHCLVTLDRTTRAVQGRWNVVLGVPGRVAELQMERNIAVETEQLVSGYKEDADKLHLYCNIVHTAKNITFCRFQRNAEIAGFNIMDGLSDGSHSYYGDGFATRQCGMTIESPSPVDYGTWRCTVGMKEFSGTVEKTSAPMQALIRVAPREQAHSDYTRQSETMADESRTLLVQKYSNLVIMCRAEVSLAYCWFQHPNGTQFTPVERQAEDERHFWYTGESLQTGDCGMTFVNVSESDVGEWTCHMGPKDQLGVEVTDKITVRVTGTLAANTKEVGVRVGGAATLYCQTANGPRPLDYCRFLTPRYVGISVDSSVTSENAILGRFYFTPERSLDYGDCSLTIDPVTNEDIGEWTCAGLVHDHTEEARDSIAVVYASRDGIHKAGIAAMSIGIIGVVFLATLLAAVVWYRKGRPIPWRRASFSDTTSNAFSFGTRTTSPTPRNSNGSASSNSSDSSNENVIHTQSRVNDINETANEIFSLEMRNVSHRDSDSSNEIPIRIQN